MTNNKNYLFLLTISPVQSFIAQARKTQDLYAGSQILSELVKTGMKTFDENISHSDKEHNIIFPSSIDSDSLPNRFIAKFEGTATEAKGKGEKIEEAVRKRWKKIAKDAVGNQSVTGFDDQIEQHLDIHWAFEEITKEGYKTAYKKLESLIGAIKNVRPFEQYNYQYVEDSHTKEKNLIVGEQGRKCSIDGQNNALFFRGIEREDGTTREKLNHLTNGKHIGGFLLEQGEGLSAVSYVKRKYKDETFPSTAQIALMQAEKDIEDEKDIDLLKCYKKLFGNKDNFIKSCFELIQKNVVQELHISDLEDNKNWLENFDYQLLYEENLVIKSIANPQQLRVAKLVLPKLKRYFKQKYYALIIFDGDKMGKWLSGDSLEEPYKSTELQTFHKEFSGLLAKFGKEATEYINTDKHNGRTVYAGGDDYLGFVNLECLFDVMSNLRIKFEELVGKPLRDKGFTTKNITFSAGIVVASYKMPLSEVLKKAREVEKIAKNKADRNAFAISVMKSSGEIQQATFKWYNDESASETSSNWKYLQKITDLLREEKFSNKFISSLSKELYQLTGTDLGSIDEEHEQLEEAVKCEIKRLLKRAKSTSKNVSDTDLSDIENAVLSLWENANPTISVNKVENFIHSLHIADFLHRKLNKNHQQNEN